MQLSRTYCNRTMPEKHLSEILADINTTQLLQGREISATGQYNRHQLIIL